MQDKEKMFFDLNSVLVKFWIENKRPDKAVKIELLERMLNWYKKMGYVTLDKQEEKKLPEGLEEVADIYAHSLGYYEEKDKAEIAAAKEDFIAEAEWQRKQDQQLIELAEDHAMLAGMNKMKEEMMEKAVGFEVIAKEGSKSIAIVESAAINEMMSKYNIGDKVKLIMIRDES